ncbi:hypothetical protein AVEN_195082-1 [Araneus ventricosus]|uniref:Uncharacterized protein n=1 Tax=Araneus ventricosus TaxID=182803 RepID=A0A4Y2BHG9_ARAVE|nr:hypothetical protein AVEN_195082-1 [Araneus ventricosus]
MAFLYSQGSDTSAHAFESDSTAYVCLPNLCGRKLGEGNFNYESKIYKFFPQYSYHTETINCNVWVSKSLTYGSDAQGQRKWISILSCRNLRERPKPAERGIKIKIDGLCG